MMKIVISMLSAGLLCAAVAHPAFAAGTAGRQLDILYSFCSQRGCPDGTEPEGLIYLHGALYGAAFAGGAYGLGAAFVLDPQTGAETVLHSFCGGTGTCADGGGPEAAPIYAHGTLYGTTLRGGDKNRRACRRFGCGTAFAIDPETGAETVLHSFGGANDGLIPDSGLIDVKGELYGTTPLGGEACSCGTAFAIDPARGKERVVHSFAGGVDGANPYSGLTFLKGLLYGTTGFGGGSGCGGSGCGTIFSIDPASGAEKVVYSFGGGADGEAPAANLVPMNGLLYGTTVDGGNPDCGDEGCGAVFSFDPASGAETAIYAFCNLPKCKDGATPFALIAMNGTLYGLAVSGGAHNFGAVFAVNPDTGAEKTLHSFCSLQECADGDQPSALIAVKGTLYGATSDGGVYGGGMVFSLRP
jgi:uncharacterized repeat protein (TIGR03803 family)